MPWVLSRAVQYSKYTTYTPVTDVVWLGAHLGCHVHEGASGIGEVVQLLYRSIITHEVAWVVQAWQLPCSVHTFLLDCLWYSCL